MPGGGKARQRIGEFVAIERLDQEAVHSCLEAGIAVFHQRIRRQGEDRGLAAALGGLAARMRLVVSMPSSAGIWISIKTRS